MKTTTTVAALSASALLALAAPTPNASASITGVTGATIWLGAPPISCAPGALTGFNAFAWDEQQNVPLSIFPTDMTNNPGNSTAAIAGPVSGAFDSHFIHFEPTPGAIGAGGTVTFSSPIVAVEFLALSLDASDALLGAPSTIYPTTYPFRGVTPSGPSFFSINANTLTFNLIVQSPVAEVAQIRVLTHSVPTPGAAALLACAGLVGLRRRRA